MLLNEIILGVTTPIQTIAPKDETKKVQPVKRIAKLDREPDVKKKPAPTGRIDTYA